MSTDAARVAHALQASQAALQRGDVAGARDLLLDADARELDPRTRYTLGMLDCMRGDYASGEPRLRSVAAETADPSVHAAWIRSLWLGGDPAGALERANRAIARFDHGDALHALRGELLDADNQPLAAADAYAAAAARNPREVSYWLRLAHALHLANDLHGAERALRSAETAAPGHPQVLAALADVLAARERHAEALEYAEKAVTRAPADPLAWRLKANALWRLDRLPDALQAVQRALELAPNDAASLQLRGLVRQASNDLVAAADDFAHAMPMRFAPGIALSDRLHRYWSRAKLRHDVEQLEHLVSNGDAALAPILETHRQALATYPRSLPDEAIVPIPQADLARLGHHYNRALRIVRAPRLAGSALGVDFDGPAIEARYAAHAPGIAWIDGFLSPQALQSLHRYCLDSTLWFDFQHPTGYLGASLQDGFAAPLLLQIVEELRARLPNVLGAHPLTQLWAFKYDARLEGTAPHADLAAVNLNFWITPDEANLDPDHGGLVVWDRQAPAEWGFAEYNGVGPEGQARIASHLQTTGADMVRIPYRANRAALFNSDLFHRTDRIHFRDGYRDRRINITMLFGERNSRPS